VLAELRVRMSAEAKLLFDGLPFHTPVDLVRDFAEPWSRTLAVAATGTADADAAHLTGLAREVFLAAAGPTDAGVGGRAQVAAAELGRRLQTPGVDHGAVADVQTFVALSQTLPRLLGGAWRELLADSAAVSSLRESPELMPRAVEELLRLGGPS